MGLFPGEPPGLQKQLRVAHRDHLVAGGQVAVRGPHILAHALNEIRPDSPSLRSAGQRVRPRRVTPIGPSDRPGSLAAVSRPFASPGPPRTLRAPLQVRAAAQDLVAGPQPILNRCLGPLALRSPREKRPDRKSTRLNSSHLVISYAA